jgi:hypothetical protein
VPPIAPAPMMMYRTRPILARPPPRQQPAVTPPPPVPGGL